ncbi:centrin-1-like [Rhynchocyon petersi]
MLGMGAHAVETCDHQACRLKWAFRNLGIQLQKEEGKAMISETAKDGAGKINFDDFFDVVSQKMYEKIAKQEILKAFKLFSDEKTGKISFENLKGLTKLLGEELTDEELQDVFPEAKLDRKGQMDQEEFLRIMRRLSFY